jgi:hypothetical protein
MLSQEEITIAKNTFKTANVMATVFYAQTKHFGFESAMCKHKELMNKYRNYAFILEHYTSDCIDTVNLDTVVCEKENIPIKYLVNCNGELS